MHHVMLREAILTRKACQCAAGTHKTGMPMLCEFRVVYLVELKWDKREWVYKENGRLRERTARFRQWTDWGLYRPRRRPSPLTTHPHFLVTQTTHHDSSTNRCHKLLNLYQMQNRNPIIRDYLCFVLLSIKKRPPNMPLVNINEGTCTSDRFQRAEKEQPSMIDGAQGRSVCVCFFIPTSR